MSDKALLMGVNEYRDIGKLAGCLEDVDNMRRLLTREYGFPGSAIRALRDREVVRANVEPAFDWLFQGSRPGDRLVLHFSGHGSYTRGGEDEERDELICLSDMNWSDPSTYFTDDELHTVTKRLPTGAHLTVVLDCCHSGTGTRSIARMVKNMARGRAATRRTLEASLAGFSIPCDGLVIIDTLPEGDRSLSGMLGKSRGSADARNFEAAAVTAEQLSFARFAPPPDWHAGRRAAKVRSRSQRPEAAMNHLLLAGSRDDETAADAHIDGKAQGAFTYHLCRAARRGPDRPIRAIFEEARAAMRDRFTQTPQLEGPFKESPLFAPGRGQAMTLPPAPCDPCRPPPRREREAAVATGTATDLIRVQEKFLDTFRLLLPESAGNGAGRSDRANTIIYVHGIGVHGRGYSANWESSLAPHLGSTPFDHREVIWSDLVNATRIILSGSDNDEVAHVRAALATELRSRAETERSTRGEAETREVIRGLLTDRTSLDDFPRYLAVPEIRDATIRRFRDLIEPPLASSRTVHVIAHSWGTVVAYEALRRMERNASLSGSVGRFFTVGSALSFRTVRARLEAGAKDGAKPALVDRWINLDAEQDLIGGELGGMGVDIDHLGLEPVGCGWGWRPVCAHSSYFHRDNEKVNRDIFAAEILGH